MKIYEININTFCFIILIMIFRSETYTDIGNLGCSDTISKCPAKAICSAHCTYPCHRVNTTVIFGTGVYSHDSPLCKAAVHDFRISTWNASLRNIVIKRETYNTLLYSSNRCGFSSAPFQYSSDGVIFLNPRILENVLDIFTLHRNYLYDNNGNHTQECYIVDGQKKRMAYFDIFSYRRYIPLEYSDPPFHEQVDGISKYKITRSVIHIKKDDIGGYQCLPKNSMLSIVTSLAMKKDAYFVPKVLTKTVNVGDNVTIIMNEIFSNQSINEVVWRKDMNSINENVLKKVSKTTLQLLNIQIGSAGIYSLENLSAKDGMFRRAVTRLIVRVCRKNYFGDNCTNHCPDCQNGGICHDIMGICICPPGFNGTLCENACEPGSFGNKCNMYCNWNKTLRNDSTSCRGILLCTADPYGCSCAPGFKNISCDVECHPGEYGAGCSQYQDCHCANGYSCNRFSGLCNNGCDEGYHGNSCSLSYPCLHKAPEILDVTETSLKISFMHWNESIDEGVGIAVSYLNVYKETGTKAWKYGPHLPKSKNNPEIFILTDLKIGTFYDIGIVVVDKSGEKQFQNIKVTNISTLCGVPKSPPLNVESKVTDKNINITWKIPPKETWNCYSLVVWVLYESHGYSEKSQVHNSFHIFFTKPYTSWNVTVCLGPKGRSSSNITCANTETVLSAEAAPGPISDIHNESLGHRNYKIGWKEPTEKNGIIRYYIVKYQQILWTHKCNLKTNLTISEVNTTTNSIILSSLIPSSVYYIEIFAVTIRPGKGTMKNIITDIDVPDGIPINVSFLRKDNYIWWLSPLCNSTYGNISNYTIRYFGIEEWNKEEEERNLTILEEHYFLKKLNLIPFSRYTFKIYAANKHGISQNYAKYTLKTNPDAPLKPTNLTVFSKTAYSLSFSWLLPYPPYGKPNYYDISCKIKGQEIKHGVNITDAICEDEIRMGYHCYSFENLKANNNYTIQVQLFNRNVENGSPYAITNGETIESVPEKPNDVSFNNRSSNSIDLQWKEPYVTNGKLTSFRVNTTVLYSFYTSIIGDMSSREIKNANIHHYSAVNLTSASVYQVCVEASTVVGYGAPFCVNFNTTLDKPVIQKAPIFLKQENSQINIKILPITKYDGPLSSYFVVVDPIFPKNHIHHRSIPTIFKPRNCSKLSGHGFIITKYVAAKIKNIPKNGLYFTIGDGKCVNGFYNAPLKPEIMYKIGIAVVSMYGKDQEYSDIKYMQKAVIVSNISHKKETHYVGAIFGFLVPLIIILAVILILVYLKKPKCLFGNRHFIMMHMKIFPKRDDPLFAASNDALEDDKDIDEFEKIETESLSEENSNRIPVNQLEAFVLNGLLNGTIKREYLNLPRGQKYPSNHAKMLENKIKNRYGNFLPYDHSRVILNLFDGVANSDYINANYIDGYKHPRKYIATQGPKQETVNDFWRMVWKEESCKIVMVTNLIESGKLKCAKYWPENLQDALHLTSNFSVKLVEIEQYADFIIRTFQVFKNKKVREVKQFHFQTWPDHGIPMYSSPVLSFLKLLNFYEPTNKNPIIIHCSAGIGRTGTIILLDCMIEMGKSEGYVDLPGHLNVMRHQRINIVENLDQYIFVYNSVVEKLCGVDTSIPCTEFCTKLPVLKEKLLENGLTHLQLEFQILTNMKPNITSKDTRNALLPENQIKNRDLQILPPDRARPILIPNSLTIGSDYINAVYINGYRQKDAYLVTQYPLSNTIYDFWRMIYESKSRTIILLQFIDTETTELDMPCYWPEENNVFVYEGFKIKCQSLKEENNISIWNFTMYPDSEINGQPLQIALYHLLSWFTKDNHPQAAEPILSLFEHVERRQQQLGNHVTTVQCFDGATACGIFCATSFVRDKIKMEHEVDIFQAVKSIRTNRPEFIKNIEQYTFLYSIAKAYMDTFETYANFQF